MLKWFEDFLDIFFLGSNLDKNTKKQLKDIKKRIISFDTDLYNVFTKEYTERFSQKIYGLYKLIQPFSQLYRNVFSDNNIVKDPRLRNFMIEHYVEEEQRKRLQFYRLGGISDSLNASDTPEKTLESIQLRYTADQTSLQSTAFTDFNTDFHYLKLFIELCQYDFTPLLIELVTTEDNKKPVFHKTKGEDILVPLLDLYFILGDFKITSGGLRQMQLLLPFVKIRNENNAKILQRSINSFAVFIQKILPPDILRDLIYFDTEDPQYELFKEKQIDPSIEAYRDDLDTRFLAAKEKALDETIKKKAEADLYELLGSSQLLELRGYDESMDKALDSKSFSTISTVYPLRILKSYIQTVMPGHQEALLSLLQNGHWLNVDLKNNYTKACNNAISLAKNIENFEDAISGFSSLSLDEIRSKLKTTVIEKHDATLIQTKIQKINQKAERTILQSLGDLQELADSLKCILEDSKTADTRILANIKTFASAQTLNHLKSFIALYNSIIKLKQVLKHFGLQSSRGAKE